MALLDVLRERTDRRHRTARVDCGELGLLSVEALPPAELARLQTDRAVLYAACRELQSAGESLRRAGKLFAPDEITAYLTDSEAASGAAAVRDISGGRTRTESEEIRLASVQAEPPVYAESLPEEKTKTTEIRPDSVQEDEKVRPSAGTDFSKIRLPSVQKKTNAPAAVSAAETLQTVRGQDSREFSSSGAKSRKTDKKSLGIVDLPGERTPNLGQNPVRPAGAEPFEAHETKSESRETLHEMKSEIHPAAWEGLHETTSEQAASGAGALHETKADFAAAAPMETHGTMGKARESVHETTSESGETGPGAMHEIRSEVREILHELEPDFTDRVARDLLDGLRRAAAVR